jgi:hypothetical protein
LYIAAFESFATQHTLHLTTMADTEGFLPLEAKAAAQAPAKRKKGKAKPAAEEEDGPSTSGAASRVVYIG